MQAISKKRWVDYAILGLFVFLVFCLIFESHLELPNLVAWLGRWHPLVLHFPIVLLLLLIFISFTKNKTPCLLFAVTTIATLITAVSGFFLGLELDRKGPLLLWHQWLGASLAILTTLWYWLFSIGFNNKYVSGVIKIILLILIAVTGHYGGMVTHGEDFLDFPKSENTEIPKNPLVYNDVVHAIFDKNCVSCHNPNKKKGELLMTNLDNLLKGGESGQAFIPSDIENSELIKRLHLPLEDEAHMPPEGKKQLSQTEIKIIEQWIALGASDTLRLSNLKDETPLAISIKELMKGDESDKWKSLPKVTDETIQELSSDYVTINRVAYGSNALSINVYLAPEHNPDIVLRLQPIAKNIIKFDASRIPLNNSEIELITSCKNLEWLEIDKTPINDEQFSSLSNLNKLELLKVFSTKISKSSLEIIGDISTLKTLYIWDTGASQSDIDNFKKAKTEIIVNDGISKETYKSFKKKVDSISK